MPCTSFRWPPCSTHEHQQGGSRRTSSSRETTLPTQPTHKDADRQDGTLQRLKKEGATPLPLLSDLPPSLFPSLLSSPLRTAGNGGAREQGSERAKWGGEVVGWCVVMVLVPQPYWLSASHRELSGLPTHLPRQHGGDQEPDRGHLWQRCKEG